MPTTTSHPQPALLEAARRGDQDAFGRLVAPYRGELHAHCYRMLGSVYDAEDALDTTVASVNSALQRARKAVEERVPDQTQQATLRALGDDGVRDLVDRYVEAWIAGDVETVVSMLTEDATFAMPPLASWFGPR